MDLQQTNKYEAWSNWLAWLLAITGVLIVAVKYLAPIHSSDIWWHMLLGRHMLETGNLIINHAIFTWTPASSHITYNAWLTEILLYLVYAKTGVIGLLTLRYLVYGGFFTLATYFAVQRGIAANPLSWLIIILGSVLAFNAMLVQPELFSLAFMYVVVWLYFFIRSVGIPARALCYLFPVIMVVWVNSHGAFVLSALFFISVGSW